MPEDLNSLLEVQSQPEQKLQNLSATSTTSPVQGTQLPETLTQVKRFSWTPFALVLLCFFLPFFQVSCQGRKLVSVTGTQLAFGMEIQEPTMFGASETQQVPGESTVLLTFLVAGAGLGLTFLKGKAGYLLPAIAGGIGFLLMLITKTRIDNEILKQSRGMLQIDYAFGFTAVCLLFLIGTAAHGYFYYLENKMNQSGQAPADNP